MVRLLWVWVTLALPLTYLLLSTNDALRVHLKGHPAESQLLVVVAYTNEDDFLTENGKVLQAHLTATTTGSALVIGALDPGVYALVVFEDLNKNGILDQNKLGIPQEPFGFSKAKLGLFGPPSFEKASFAFPAENDIEVQLKRF